MIDESMNVIAVDSIFVTKEIVDDDPSDIFTVLRVIGGDHIGLISIGDTTDEAKMNLARKLEVSYRKIVVIKEAAAAA